MYKLLATLTLLFALGTPLQAAPAITVANAAVAGNTIVANGAITGTNVVILVQMQVSVNNGPWQAVGNGTITVAGKI